MKNEAIYNKELAKRFRTLREDAELTQEQLASRLHISPVQVYNYEKARRRITEQTADLMAMIFSIDASYLLDETVKYRTAAEKIKTEFQTAINESNQEAYYMYNAICCLAALNGYTVEIKGKSDIANDLRKVLPTGKGKIGDSFKEYMVFYRNGKKEFSLSLEDANHFGNHINDIFLSHIKWNVKTE